MGAVILCEKPSQALDLAKALGGVIARGPGFIDCPAARLTWAVGRLLEPAPPQAYDERYKRWRIEDLPIVPEPEQWLLLPREKVRDQLQYAIDVLKRASLIYIATDAGREGELIAYELIERAGSKAPIKRLWFSAQDERSLKRAWANPRAPQETVHLFHAAQIRQRADWLFGINLSRAATLRLAPPQTVFSYSRVPTTTL